MQPESHNSTGSTSPVSTDSNLDLENGKSKERDFTQAPGTSTEYGGKMPGIKEIMIGRSDLYRVNPNDLHVETGFNARDYNKADTLEHVASLAQKIKSNGFDSSRPIKAKLVDGKLIIRDGECRYRAVMQLISEGVEIQSVPVIVVKTNDTQDVIEMVNANDGKKLDAFEEADAFRRLVSFGLTTEEIANRIGKGIAYVSERLLLAETDGEVRSLVREKVIPLTATKDIVKASTEKRTGIVAAAKEARANGKKVSLKAAQKAAKGHANYIAYGTVKKLLEDLQERALANPADEKLRWQIEGVKLVLAI